MRNPMIGALALAAALLPSIAWAQPGYTRTTDSAPIVIHAGAAGEEGVITERRQQIQRQRVTAMRAAVLDEPAVRVSVNDRQRAGFPAGERLFGIYDGDKSWTYCALRAGFFRELVNCYQDTDNDGRLDLYKPSGMPFLGVPFFIFFPNASEIRPLPAPVAFHRINYAEGPAIDAALQVTLTETRRRRGEMQPGRVEVAFGFSMEGQFAPMGSSASHIFASPDAAILNVAGAQVEFSGAPVRGQLRYRVLAPMPAHIERVVMTQTVTYTPTTTYIPIFIPR